MGGYLLQITPLAEFDMKIRPNCDPRKLSRKKKINLDAGGPEGFFL